jgi:hypothetical protein
MTAQITASQHMASPASSVERKWIGQYQLFTMRFCSSALTPLPLRPLTWHIDESWRLSSALLWMVLISECTSSFAIAAMVAAKGGKRRRGRKDVGSNKFGDSLVRLGGRIVRSGRWRGRTKVLSEVRAAGSSLKVFEARRSTGDGCFLWSFRRYALLYFCHSRPFHLCINRALTHLCRIYHQKTLGWFVQVREMSGSTCSGRNVGR